MSVKNTVKHQYIKIINRAAGRAGDLRVPSEGWITTWRKALGMSGRQLAERAGTGKASIHQAERKEREGGVTIKHMEKLAAALGGRFVYAIVPVSGDIGDIVCAQARLKAEKLVRRASSHMALEKQSLSARQNREEIERLASQLVHTMPPDFWD